MLTEETLASGMRVWIAQPDTTEKRPALLLLHERYGPVEHSFNIVKKMAKEGFVVAVNDLFHRYEGDRGPIERAEARLDLTDDEALVDMDETLAYLRTLPYVDGDNIGVVGFCLSGRMPMLYAAARDDVAGIAVVHGGAYPRDFDGSTEGQVPVSGLIPRIGCPVLGAFGEFDRLVPLENVHRFRNELEEAGKSFQILVFAGAAHGWMNTTTPEAFHQEATDAAWGTMVAFFTSVFAGGWPANRIVSRFESDVTPHGPQPKP
jgi:carboxymethylenebutenolidase